MTGEVQRAGGREMGRRGRARAKAADHAGPAWSNPLWIGAVAGLVTALSGATIGVLTLVKKDDPVSPPEPSDMIADFAVTTDTGAGLLIVTGAATAEADVVWMLVSPPDGDDPRYSVKVDLERTGEFRGVVELRDLPTELQPKQKVRVAAERIRPVTTSTASDGPTIPKTVTTEDEEYEVPRSTTTPVRNCFDRDGQTDCFDYVSSPQLVDP